MRRKKIYMKYIVWVLARRNVIWKNKCVCEYIICIRLIRYYFSCFINRPWIIYHFTGIFVIFFLSRIYSLFILQRHALVCYLYLENMIIEQCENRKKRDKFTRYCHYFLVLSILKVYEKCRNFLSRLSQMIKAFNRIDRKLLYTYLC